MSGATGAGTGPSSGWVTSAPPSAPRSPGTILVSDLASGNRSYVLATSSLAAIALIGLVAAWRLPAPETVRSRPAST